MPLAAFHSSPGRLDRRGTQLSTNRFESVRKSSAFFSFFFFKTRSARPSVRPSVKNSCFFRDSHARERRRRTGGFLISVWFDRLDHRFARIHCCTRASDQSLVDGSSLPFVKGGRERKKEEGGTNHGDPVTWPPMIVYRD